MIKAKKPVGEVAVMGVLEEALEPLGPEERGRVLRWASERFGDGLTRPREVHHEGRKQEVDGDDEPQELGELYAQADPTTEPERALVVAYFVQEVEGNGEFDSQTVNNQLKHLGHAVSNITRTMDDLKNRRPQLVIQIEKSGKTKQARKRFKVTAAGKTEVKRMLAGKTE